MAKKKRRNKPSQNKQSGYRRNRPLAFSERESRLQARKKSVKYKLVASVFLVVFLSAAGYWALSTTVSTVEVVTDSQDLRSAIKEQSEEYLTTENRIVLLNESELKTFIIDQNPRIRSLDISVNYIDATLHITATERTPQIMIQNNGVQYYIDNVGIAYPTTNTSRTDNLPLVIDETSVAIRSGEQAVSKTFVSFITTLDNSITAMDKSIKFYKTTGVTRNIIAVTRDNIEILFDTNIDERPQIEKLQETLEYIEQNNIDADSLDLRTDKKVFID